MQAEAYRGIDMPCHINAYKFRMLRKKHGGGHNVLNINTQAFSIRHCNNHKSVYRQAIYSYHGGCAFVPNDYSRINAKVIISFHIIKDLLYEYHLSEKNKAKKPLLHLKASIPYYFMPILPLQSKTRP
jgi:hypothetical protein